MTLLASLVAVSQRVAATRSRSAKIRELAAGIRELLPEEVVAGVLYLCGEVRQPKLGLGGATLREVATTAPAGTATLAVLEVDTAFERISECRGSGSAARRTAILQALFGASTSEEQHYLLRLAVGELRQGALAGLMLEALALATQLEVSSVRRAAMYAGNVGMLARAALTGGAAALAQLQLQVLTPVAPMLAQTAVDVEEALQQLGGIAAFEWKIDGARVQVHKSGSTVRVFTRSLNDVTAAVPEVVAAVQSLPAEQLVLDGETIAVDASGGPQPFQVTMRRFARKLDVEVLRGELPLQVYFFDCLLRTHEPCVERRAAERHALLEAIVPAALRSPRLVTDDLAQARDFYTAALAAGHEGVMAKSLDAPYEAGSRGAGWLKIKRIHTLDLVVLAAEWGHGRRTGTLSNLHLGARDPHGGGYVMLGKTFKGLTDELLHWQTAELLAREAYRDQWTVYVRPELVVEIAFNDIQASSQYPGGFALRFARVKQYRPDKRAAEADTIDTIRALYAAQGADPLSRRE
jgi:DNA ligase-1